MVGYGLAKPGSGSEFWRDGWEGVLEARAVYISQAFGTGEC